MGYQEYARPRLGRYGWILRDIIEIPKPPMRRADGPYRRLVMATRGGSGQSKADGAPVGNYLRARLPAYCVRLFLSAEGCHF